jgi:prepilin-type N-terminal cleavage/methylation domain-containing protein
VSLTGRSRGLAFAENGAMTMHKKHQKAFTLVELLLSLAIFGMLMAAVAVAFDASVKNYQDNQGIYRTVNTARQTLLRLTNDVRTAESVAVVGTDGDPDNTQLTLRTANQDITYRYDATDKILYLHTAETNYVLCRNIDAMSFERAPVADSNPVAVRNVRIVMTVTDPDSGVSQTLAAAAVVRRNL